MDIITMDMLKQTFVDSPSDSCVSLYMPTHRAGQEREQDPIRYKNLLRKAEEGLQTRGLRAPEVQGLLKEPRRLAEDRDFWRRQSDGLSLFFSEETCLFSRLPMTFEELTVVSHRFHIKPLLPLLASDGVFFILAVSRNRVRLLEGTRHRVDGIELEAPPQGIAEEFPEAATDRPLQFHTGTSSGGAKRPAMFHGHDLSKDAKNRTLRFFRTIDEELRDILQGRKAPLILAGVDSLFSLYREANTYPYLMQEGIPGNPEGLRDEELPSQAWALVESVFTKAQEESAARYRQLAGTGKTTTDVQEAVSAAHHGKVDVLFVAVGKQLWGRYDRESDRVYVHEVQEPGDEDLLDLAAIRCLIQGGPVHALARKEVPDQALLAAVLRF